ncbi:MAG: AraC family transcriptional regulator [Myxococcota bacterium]
MVDFDRLDRLAHALDEKIKNSGDLCTAPDGLGWLQQTEESDFRSTVYTPVVCLILRGEKVTTVGGQTYRVAKGCCIIVSHDLPVESRITAAPYLALVARLDLPELRALADEVDEDPTDRAEAYAVSPVDEPVLDVMTRYVELFGDRTGQPVLVPLLRRELHFRLLRARHGSMLRSLLRHDSHASNISRAIRTLREEFRNTLEVPKLARAVGMSTSSFHRHFKQVTNTTPLQFLKELRLAEARRLILGGSHSVSSAAFEVGYESPTQFSREYSRKFGGAPSGDLQRFRA